MLHFSSLFLARVLQQGLKATGGLLAFVLLCLPGRLPAQGFSDQTGSVFSLPPGGVTGGRLRWADFNANATLDFAVSGEGILGTAFTSIYSYNSSTGNFSLFASLTGLRASDLAWGDYDGDGDQDLAISGETLLNQRLTEIYTNTGASFVKDNTASAVLQGARHSALAWGDYDNDGDLDLAVSGDDGAASPLRIYRNEGNSVFVQAISLSPGIRRGTLAWGDADNDGDLDLIALGETPSSGQAATRFYRNNGSNNFAFVNTGLPDLKGGSASWGDYDNDGLLDLLLCGEDNTGSPASYVYKNYGNSGFGQVAILSGIFDGEAIWADYNNDGWLDIFLAGSNGPASRLSAYYRNDQSGGFTLQTDNFPDLGNGAALAAGDYSGDGRPDLLLAGNSSTGKLLRVFRNDFTQSNPAPTAPQSLSAQQTGVTVNFTWRPPAGYAPDRVAGLSYNLYIGSSPGTAGIRHPAAAIPGGQRRLPAPGAIADTSWRITGLTAGIYYWSVQAIEPDFDGSPFAAEGSFTYAPQIISSNSSFTDVTNLLFSPAPLGRDEGDAAWADIDGDNDLDFVITGLSGSGSLVADAYRRDPAGYAAFSWSATLSDLQKGDLDWGDVNNDNRPDLLMMGENSSAQRVTELWVNTGGVLVKQTLSPALAGFRNGSVDWGDYDNDGDQDLLISGNTAIGRKTYLYRNAWIPSGTLAFAKADSLDAVDLGSAVFGDFNRDGYPDIAISGDAGASKIFRIYRNNGGTGFSLAESFTGGLFRSSLAWGDLNQDGLLDLVANGFENALPFTRAYLAADLGGGIYSFSQVTMPELRGVANGSVALGDYNDDGYPDLLASGVDNTAGGIFYLDVYRHNGDPNNPRFLRDTASSTILLNVGQGSRAAWGDYDNDGKLDILVLGQLNGAAGKIVKVYRNVESTPSVKPQDPIKLTSQLIGDRVKLFWNPPPTSSALQQSYTYAVYVDKAGGGTTDIRSPLALISAGAPADGYRRVPEIGRDFTNNEIFVKDLTPGAYTWSVQAIDAGLQGSEFAPEQSFEYEDPTFMPVAAETFLTGHPVALRQAALDWGDFNNDGFLDLAVAGRSIAEGYRALLYVYDSFAGKFAPSSFGNQLPASRDGSLHWGSFDRNDWPDLLICGETSAGLVSRVYRNKGPGFLNAVNDTFQLPGIRHGMGKFVDIDNDGLAEVLLSGENSANAPYTRFYSWTPGAAPGDSNWQERGSIALLQFKNSAFDFGDVNNDGYPDLVLTGENAAGQPQMQLYHNNRSGGFTAVASPFEAVKNGAVQWGDYNADGLLDLLLAGENAAGNRITRVYRQSASGFTNISNVFIGISEGTAAWGDFNNDGYKDFVITGQDGPASEDRGAYLYQFNPVTGTFINRYLAAAAFTPISQGMAAWADYDRNGKLDLVMAGQDSDAPTSVFQLYKNIDPAAATQPNAPTGLASQIKGYEVELRWQAPANLPAAIRRGLSYNVYVERNAQVVRSPLARLSDGRRQVVFQGLVNDTTAFRLRNLPGGSYTWRVQAIDADFEGSAFSATASFTYELPTLLDVTAERFGTLPAGLSDGTLRWVDYDTDGDLDLMVAGNTAAAPLTRVFRNQGGNFAAASLPFRSLRRAAFDWSDMNGDNLPDLIISGEDAASQPFTRLYRNLGGGQFDSLATTLPDLARGALAWGDYENDGDPDLLAMGQNASGVRIANLYQQTAPGQFAALSLGLPGLSDGDVAWLDYNRDGFLDFVIAGNTGSSAFTALYRNSGFGTFQQVPLALPSGQALTRASLDVADLNNDGFPDLLISGRQNDNTPISGVMRYNPATGAFVPLVLANLADGDLAWGDYNNDGLTDIVLTGSNSAGIRLSQLYQNQGNNTFAPRDLASLPLQDVRLSAVAWGDFSGDRKLDLALMGESASSQVLRLYQNVDTAQNTSPQVPSGLSATQAADTLIFTWNPGPSGAGYTYELSLSNSAQPQPPFLRAPLASLPGGQRYLARPGRAGSLNTYKLWDIPAGTYDWRVQAVDPDFEGSAFSAASSVSFVPPPFVNVNLTQISPQVPGFSKAAICWADMDADGDLDLLAAGEVNNNLARTLVLRNSGGFLAPDAAASAGLDSLLNARAAWADFDRDGDMDLLLCGERVAGLPQTRLYVNAGGTFAAYDFESDLPPLTLAAAAWGDYDNDGDLDLALSGRQRNGQPLTAVYRQQNGRFVPDPAIVLPPVEAGDLAWGDYDQDGDLDLALAGAGTGGNIASIYRNPGYQAGGWVALAASAAPFPGLRDASLAWGDYNADGFLDLALMGDSLSGGSGLFGRVYRYDASDKRFVRLRNIEGARQGSLAWGDYDNDGFQDLILAGSAAAGRTARLYRSDGLGLAEQSLASSFIQGADQGASLAWGDFDNDGKLDFALAGRLASSPATRRGLLLYRNESPAVPSAPGAPAGLSASTQADSVILSWNAPAGGPYTYNLYVGPEPLGPQQVSPQALASSGYRLLPARGNAGAKLSYRLMNPPADTFYWSVQAVDAAFEGSAFAQEQSFTFSPPHVVLANAVLFDTTALLGLAQPSLAWGDYTGDGRLDFAAMGSDNNGNPVFQLYRQEIGGNFSPDNAARANIPQIEGGKLAWGDVDNDNDLDLAISGSTAAGLLTDIYWNDNGVFRASGAGLAGLEESSLAWGDYDNDGDLDLFLMGKNASAPAFSQLYRNLGNRVFDAPGLAWEALTDGDAVWADINRDGRLDLVYAGRNAAGLRVIAYYRNRGDGTFQRVAAPFNGDLGLSGGSLSAGDVNNDGYPDLLLTGSSAAGQPETRIYINQRNDSFQPLSVAGLPALTDGAARFGDFSSDGWTDIALAGRGSGGAAVAQVWVNDQQGGFANDLRASSVLPAFAEADLAWGDYDRDGKLDLLYAGRPASGTARLAVYRSLEPSPNSQPEAPANLSFSIEGSNLILSWDVPPGYPSSLVEGLSYNLFMGQTDSSVSEITPMSRLRDGFRSVAAAGNAGQRAQWLVKGLEVGKSYFWSVQSVQPDFEGSAFDTVLRFDYLPPAFEDATAAAFPDGAPLLAADGALSLADYDRDGDYDLLAIGDLGNGQFATTAHINNGGVFAPDAAAAAALPGLRLGAIAWSDYNQDGSLDLLLCGQRSDLTLHAGVYRYQNGAFAPDQQAGAQLTPVYKSAAAWADYDNDGDYDLLLSGDQDANALSPLTRLYENVQGTLIPLPDAGLANVSSGSAVWADYDRDGRLDLAISGESATGALLIIYRNDSLQGFLPAVSDLPQVRNSSLDWTDVNNDGYPDLLFTGESSNSVFEPFTRLYVYNPAAGRFDRKLIAGLDNLSRGSAHIADFNNDGWAEFVIAGRGLQGPATRLFRNNGAGDFQEDLLTSQDLQDVESSSIATADYNGDGKLDLFFLGKNAAGQRSFALYRNIDTTLNTRPGPPRSLSQQIYGATVTLSWEAPANVPPGVARGLSYNVYLGTASQPERERSPLAAPAGTENGRRWVVAPGANSHVLRWQVRGIPDGSYQWSVQAVDQDYEGSPFPVPLAFSFTNPVPIIVDSSFAAIYPDDQPQVESWIRLQSDTLVQQVRVHYKGIASGQWQQENVSLASGRYTFAITLAKVDEIGIEYYFEIIGKFGFDLRSGIQYAYRKYAQGLEATNLRTGSRASAYNIISLPLRLDDPMALANLEDDLGKYSIFRWRLWRYNGAKNSEERKTPIALQPGEGYWLIIRRQNAFRSLPGLAVEANDSQPFVLSLRQGWNLIGNPYNFNLSWQDVLNLNGPAVDDQLDDLLLYEGAYQPGSVVGKMRGAWVFAEQALEVQVPVRKNLSVQRQASEAWAPVAEGHPGDEHWQLPLILESEGLRYPLGGIGMHPDALAGRDPFDAITPPRPDAWLELNFEHPEHFVGVFTRDVAPLRGQYAWTFQVEAMPGTREAWLHWDRAAVAAGQKSLWLIDAETQVRVDMGLSDALRISLEDGKPRRYHVYLGDLPWLLANVKPAHVSVGDAFPDPATTEINFPVNIPESQYEAEVTLHILDAAGRELVVAGSYRLRAGFHQLSWQLRDASGRLLPPGIYICQVVAVQGGEKQVLPVKFEVR